MSKLVCRTLADSPMTPARKRKLARLAAQPDSEIDFSEIPPLADLVPLLPLGRDFLSAHKRDSFRSQASSEDTQPWNVRGRKCTMYYILVRDIRQVWSSMAKRTKRADVVAVIDGFPFH